MSRLIDDIKRDVVKRYPFFGSLVECLDYVETRNCVGYNGKPTAATNGTTVYYHPDFIANLSEEQRTFVFAHEICHVAFDHMNRGEGKDQEIWNYATDAVINAFLKKDGLEFVENVIDIPWAIYYDAETMYKKLLKKKQREQKKKKNANSSNNPNRDVGHDTHRMWKDKSLPKGNEQAIENIQKEFKRLGKEKVLNKKDSKEIKGILEGLKKVIKELGESSSKGKMTASIGGNDTDEEEVQFEPVGNGYPLINWPLILKKQKEIVELDWSYENAYLEDGVVQATLEENSYKVSYDTEIVLDTSSSISDELLRSFLRECKNILNFSNIRVGCFDVKFYGFKTLKSINEVDDFKFVGRGGTDFNVAVKAFSKQADNKIIFTDGEASMPNTCDDIIWVVFGKKKISPPNGKVIYIDPGELIKLCEQRKLELKMR